MDILINQNIGSDSFIDIASILQLLVTMLGFYFGYVKLNKQILENRSNIDRKFNLDKRHENSKEHIPFLIEILEDLYSLHNFIVYEGIFDPQIEPRGIWISDDDIEEEQKSSNQMSAAQRTHQFYKIGLKVINNCRKIIYLGDRKHIPNTISVCKGIRSFLTKKDKDKKRKLDLMQTQLCTVLEQRRKSNSIHTNVFREYEKDFREYEKRILEFHYNLDKAAERELSKLSGDYHYQVDS